MYSTDFDGHYPSKLSQLTPNYLKTIPTCPYGPEEYTYLTATAYNTGGFSDYYFLACTNGRHHKDGEPPGYPQYDAIQGTIEWR